MKKMVGFGDFLLRLNPEGYLRFWQADRMLISYTGAEANVCLSLSMLGMPAEFVTRLPDNDIARCALAELRKYGVCVEHVALGGERMGLLYLEKGASQRPSRIVYDRKYTSVATSRLEDYDWNAIMKDAGYFHVTGITPALGEDMPRVCEAAMKAAKAQGAVVSCDLNYRRNLWSRQQAGQVMTRLLKYVDVLIANEEDCADVLGITARDTDVKGGKLSQAGYGEVARKLCGDFGFSRVAITLRGSLSASENEWGAMVYEKGQAYFSRTYRVHLVDRVGGGDSFAAGLIFAMARGDDPQSMVEFAAAASCLKQTIEMDYNLSTLAEVELLAGGDSSGRVRR